MWFTVSYVHSGQDGESFKVTAHGRPDPTYPAKTALATSLQKSD